MEAHCVEHILRACREARANNYRPAFLYLGQGSAKLLADELSAILSWPHGCPDVFAGLQVIDRGDDENAGPYGAWLISDVPLAGH